MFQKSKKKNMKKHKNKNTKNKKTQNTKNKNKKNTKNTKNKKHSHGYSSVQLCHFIVPNYTATTGMTQIKRNNLLRDW
jgi:hypothetical protein